MSIWAISKRFFNKKQTKSTDSDVGLNMAASPTATENPYLSARRSWNDHVGSVMSSRQTWQVMGILCLMIALASVGGMIHIGSQSKFIPYIIEIDKLGQSLAISPAQLVAIPDQRVVHSAVASFINDARLVTPDIALQRKAVFRVYAMLSANDPATAKSNQWFNGSEDASPFNRAKKETVSIEIHTVIPQTPETWQVDWVETRHSFCFSFLG